MKGSNWVKLSKMAQNMQNKNHMEGAACESYFGLSVQIGVNVVCTVQIERCITVMNLLAYDKCLTGPTRDKPRGAKVLRWPLSYSLHVRCLMLTFQLVQSKVLLKKSNSLTIMNYN